MGLINLLIRIFGSKKQKDNVNFSQTEEALDQYIKNSMKQNQDALRVAKKLSSIKLLNQQTNELMRNVRQNDDDEDDEDLESSSKSVEDRVMEMLLGKFLNKDQSTKAPLEELAFGNQQENSSPDLSQFQDLIPTLTDQQKQILKDKGFF